MPQLEDVGRTPGGDTLRSFLSVAHNDDGSLKPFTFAADPSGDTTGVVDTANLQTALNNAAGGVLRLGIGTYTINGTLTYSGTKPVAIIGQGMEETGGITKIKAATSGQFSGTQVGTTGWFPLLSVANTSNVNHFRFESLYFDMTGYTDTIGLYCDQVGYTTFDSLKFREGAIGLAGLRLAGSNMSNLHAWNQAAYGFAELYTDGPGGTGAGTIAVTTNGQANSWTDCEYRMTTSTNNCIAGYAVLSGQQDVNFTNCHAERLTGVTSGIQCGFLVKGPVSTWPPDATWAGECHLVQCNADGITDQASGTGAGFWFENYRHVRLDQSWDSAMDTTNAWYSPAVVVKQCQDVILRGSEISSNGLQLQGNVDLLIVSNNHFLNAGTTTTALTIGSATLTNLVFEGNTKKVTSAAWCDNMPAFRTARQHNNNIEGPMRSQAVTAANTALQNGTPTFLSWVTPNDGQQHAFLIVGTVEVTVTETGGQILMTYTHNGATNNIQLVAASQGVGAATIFAGRVADPNTVVSVQQGSALTAGTATISAAIVGS